MTSKIEKLQNFLSEIFDNNVKLSIDVEGDELSLKLNFDSIEFTEEEKLQIKNIIINEINAGIEASECDEPEADGSIERNVYYKECLKIVNNLTVDEIIKILNENIMSFNKHNLFFSLNVITKGEFSGINSNISQYCYKILKIRQCN